MEEAIIAFCSKNGINFHKPTFYHLPSHNLLSPTRRRRLKTHFRNLSSNTSSISVPASPHFSKPSKIPKLLQSSSIISPHPHSQNEFGEKMLYLESIGIDFFSLIDDYPSVISTSSLEDIKSTFHYMRSLGFSSFDFRRICGMCPEILTYRISDISPVFTFLLREANVKGSDLRKVVNRRPRLLACSVGERLRPTLYFLQSLGITEVQKYTSLLSCSVEDKFIPRIDYMEKTMGFSYRDVVSMVRRFPQLFCYSIKHNFEPKFNYFVMEMGRDLKELKEFPHYFSFSLEKRIKPRHLSCVSKGVYLPLPVMLKTHETMFRHRLEVCFSSSPPLTTSPLWWSTSAHNYLCKEI
ncbi:Transcription termination factor mtef1 protein [Thalictrum thalictroides]|uniref:Transcription termination factor mtef1 protein n=1 Tax=Thalictrum thalictroides TaxID=46969 RepID=A0A7J6X531_THATH|nr:Transcription termination factor mtef1 protein [Thalictrum thalictroides]